MKSNKNHSKNRHKNKENLKQFVVNTKFVFAKNLIESGDIDAFLDLLDGNKIDINDIGEIKGPNFLMLASEAGSLNLVQELLRRGIDINYQDGDDWNALLIAAKEDYIDIVNELLDAGADIESRDCGGFCALMWAAYFGKLEMAKMLLKRNANPNVYDRNQISPLIWASGRGYTEVVNLLISNGAKVDSPDKYGTTALIWAARKGHFDIAKKLIKCNASVDSTGMLGWTPLIVATRGNHEDMVELILSHKPNTNTYDAQGLTPLMTASKEGNLPIVNLLIFHNSYVNLTDGNGDTALIHAAKAGNLPVVEALIKAHAAVDHQGGDRKTALYSAIEKGHIEITKALLKANANVELPNRDGDTPLMKAVRSRRVQVVKLLLERKAKVSSVDKYGDCALHIAARAQAKSILELLLRNPRNSQLLYKPNYQGESAFQLDAAHQRPILPSLFGAAPSARRVLEKETQLGYDLYSSAIANLLSEPTLKTPVCVGLFAKWGSGKSFLLGKLRNDLSAFEDDSPNSYGKAGSKTLASLITIVLGSLGALCGFLIGENTIWSAVGIVIAESLFWFPALIFYLGYKRYEWTISANIVDRVRKAQTLLQVCFAHPPQRDYEQVSSQAVRFLFTEQPVKLSSDHNVTQLVAEIHRSLWNAIQKQNGFLPVCMYRVFKPKPGISRKWRWRRVFCMIPTFFFVIALFLALVLIAALLLTPSPLWKVYQDQPVLGYVLVGFLSVVGAWTLANLFVPLQMLRELLLPTKAKTREELRADVQQMQSCINCLDAFNGRRQTRLVIVMDALESIYESDRLMSFLEAININFLSCKSSTYSSVPFVIIFTLDPHHHVTSKSKEYLKTIVHLPFYLQNSQLRRVKVAQQVESIVPLTIAHSGSIKLNQNGLQKPRSRKSGNVLKSADSIISLSGPTGEAPIRVLLTDDYFSDMNLKSMRRIMNIVYIQGRLLKAFNLEFNWHKLTTWVNITEQWPVRVSAIIAFYEMNENKYTDDHIPLKLLYDKVEILLRDLDTELLARDADEKKLGIFLSCNNAFQLGDLKIFSPFTVNLDPCHKRRVQETLSMHSLANIQCKTPTTMTSGGFLVSEQNQRNLLAELSVEGVTAILRKIEGFDQSMVEKYSQTLRNNNISGKVLSNCTAEDLIELKALLNFNFGDWLLFRRQVIENKQLLNLHRLAPADGTADRNAEHFLDRQEGRLISRGGTAASSLNNLTMIGRMNADGTDRKVSDTRSPINSLLLQLEKQVTMEEAALQSDVKEDDEIETDRDSISIDSVIASPNELNVLYIGANATGQRNSNSSVMVDVEMPIDESTPLASPSKSSVSSTSTASSPSKKRLERQKPLDP